MILWYEGLGYNTLFIGRVSEAFVQTCGRWIRIHEMQDSNVKVYQQGSMK